MPKLSELYDDFRTTPFPRLGKSVGNFPLYDAHFAGLVQQAARGGPRPSASDLEPDEESRHEIAALRAKASLSADEKEFLAYVGRMERIRAALRETKA